MESVEELVYSIPDEELLRRLPFKDAAEARSAMTAILVGAFGDDPGWSFQPFFETDRTTEEERPLTELADQMLNLASLTEPVIDGESIVEVAPNPGSVLADVAKAGFGEPTRWRSAIKTVPLADLKKALEIAHVLSEDFADVTERQKLTSEINFPKALIELGDVPRGRGGEAIRARVERIVAGLMLMNLPGQNEITASLEAFQSAGDSARRSTTQGK